MSDFVCIEILVFGHLNLCNLQRSNTSPIVWVLLGTSSDTGRSTRLSGNSDTASGRGIPKESGLARSYRLWFDGRVQKNISASDNK
jgi:hypothetical protein